MGLQRFEVQFLTEFLALVRAIGTPMGIVRNYAARRQELSRTSSGIQQDVVRNSAGRRQELSMTSVGIQQDVGRSSAGRRQEFSRTSAGTQKDVGEELRRTSAGIHQRI